MPVVDAGQNVHVSSESPSGMVPTIPAASDLPFRTHLGVTFLQLLVAGAYARALFVEAPPAFSLADWVFIALPPLAFGGAWHLGRRVRVPRHSRVASIVRRVGAAVAAFGFFATLLLVPISLFGSLMDSIG